MNPIQNLAFEEHLVRSVEQDGEPWFVGKDVCAVLSIGDHNRALNALDEDERGGHTVPTPSGEQTMIIVSEAGVFRLIFRSRKPEAERFKRWLAHEVLPQLRRTGQFSSDKQEQPVLSAIAQDAPLAARVDAVRLARSLFGSERARALWQELGLPHVPPPSPFHGAGEAAECLKMLLAHEVRKDTTLRAAIEDAADGNLEARALCEMVGVRVSEESDGFWISNTSRPIAAVYEGTAFAGRWQMILRRLERARTGERMMFAGHRTRVVWLPLAMLDDEYLKNL